MHSFGSWEEFAPCCDGPLDKYIYTTQSNLSSNINVIQPRDLHNHIKILNLVHIYWADILCQESTVWPDFVTNGRGQIYRKGEAFCGRRWQIAYKSHSSTENLVSERVILIKWNNIIWKNKATLFSQGVKYKILMILYQEYVICRSDKKRCDWKCWVQKDKHLIFKVNPGDMALLKHDKPLAKRVVAPHLKHLPNYLRAAGMPQST